MKFYGLSILSPRCPIIWIMFSLLLFVFSIQFLFFYVNCVKMCASTALVITLMSIANEFNTLVVMFWVLVGGFIYATKATQTISCQYKIYRVLNFIFFYSFLSCFQNVWINVWTINIGITGGLFTFEGV